MSSISNPSGTIGSRQNEQVQQHLIASQRYFYSKATECKYYQILFAAILPLAGVILNYVYSPARPWVAVYGVLAFLLDWQLIEKQIPRLTRHAALVQEKFDRHVLALKELSRNSAAPSTELRSRAAKSYLRKSHNSQLKDWYPAVVDKVPITFGRLICQRSNMVWTDELRQRIRLALLIFGWIVAIVSIGLGLALDMQIRTFALIFIAPLLPVFRWAGKEYEQQGTASDAIAELRRETELAWDKILNNARAGNDINENATELAERLQGELLARRIDDPIILGPLYQMQRSQNEEEMRVSAEEHVEEVLKALATAQPPQP